MRTVLAIAGIAIRNAVRSRVVVVLLGLLLVAIIALPLTIKGDGTVTGTAQVLLRYTLAAVNIILSVATLWAGCAAVSTEVQDRQVHLIMTKPVHGLQLWLGKWLGLLLVNFVLLGIAGTVSYSLMRVALDPAKLSPRDQEILREEILVARRVVAPEPIDVEADARAVFAEQQRRGELPQGQRPDQALEAIRQTLLREAHTVLPGMARRFVFPLSGQPERARPLVVRYKFDSSVPGQNPVACVWVAGDPQSNARYRLDQWSAPGGLHTVTVPAAAVGSDGKLVLDVANVNSVPLTMVFSPKDGVEVLVYESGFVANLARGLLVMLAQLGFLAALAVTLGSIFSLPVAALSAAYCVLLMNMGSYLQTLVAERFFLGAETGPGAAPGLVDNLLRLVYLTLYWATKPFQASSPLEPLAVGELVSWTWVGSIFFWQVAVAGTVVALIGAAVFNRRELGLPG